MIRVTLSYALVLAAILPACVAHPKTPLALKDGDLICTRSEAIEAAAASGPHQSWEGVYNAFQKYGACDDGAIAEGFSDSVATLLTSSDSLKQLTPFIRRDVPFQIFVLRHLDELMTPQQARAITKSLSQECPEEIDSFCKRATARLKDHEWGVRELPPLAVNGSSVPIRIYDGEAQLKIIPWKRRLVLRGYPGYEDGWTSLIVYDSSGAMRSAPERVFIGDLYVLQPSKRLLLAQYSSHFSVDRSYLLDENGIEVAEISQNTSTFSWGVSDDGAVFWNLAFGGLRAGKPSTELRAYDHNGTEVSRQVFRKAGSATIKFEGKRYRVEIPEPDFPG